MHLIKLTWIHLYTTMLIPRDRLEQWSRHFMKSGHSDRKFGVWICKSFFVHDTLFKQLNYILHFILFFVQVFCPLVLRQATSRLIPRQVRRITEFSNKKSRKSLISTPSLLFPIIDFTLVGSSVEEWIPIPRTGRWRQWPCTQYQDKGFCHPKALSLKVLTISFLRTAMCQSLMIYNMVSIRSISYSWCSCLFTYSYQ
jgi:hypothetical protein